jgi:hypothetical protein
MKNKKIIALITLMDLIGLNIPLNAFASTITVAPNMMVIFGNSYSMNKILGDTATPQIPSNALPKSLHLNDTSYNNAGITFNIPLYGSQSPATGNTATNATSQSKLYVAKTALAQVLNDSSSNNVNIGFSTFRQSFGMEVAATLGTIKTASFQIADQTFSFGTTSGTTSNSLSYSAISSTSELTGSATTQDKTNYGVTPTNFQFMYFWPWYVYGGGVNRSAYLGKGMLDDGKGVFNDSVSSFVSGAAKGGIPTKFSAAPVISGQYAYPYKYTGTSSSPDLTKPRTTLMDQNYASSSYGTNSVNYQLFTTGNQDPTDVTLVNFYLCGTGYSSQSNYFTASYLLDKSVINGYETPSSVISTTWVDWNSFLFDATGTITYTGSSKTCSGYTGNTNSQYIRQSNTYRGVNDDNISTSGAPVISVVKDDPNRTYFSAIPNYYSGNNKTVGMLNEKNGVMDGWSGETTYVETVGATNSAIGTGTTTANYPSYTANPDGMPVNGGTNPGCILNSSGVATNIGTSACRQLYTKNYQQTSAKHMGVFLDLPAPNLGYVDQRSIIAKTDSSTGDISGFMALSAMSQSGLDYNPSTQIIKSSDGKLRGINASAEPYNSNQSPIYDSLTSALAYYTAYKAKDPYNNCRNNNILLFFDGKEDAHWYTNSSGQSVYADPSAVAKQLQAIGVTTYVVILSNNSGDISSANKIAAAGGTNVAYAASDANSLLSAFKTVFTGLSGSVVASSPALQTQVTNNGIIYQAAYDLSPINGHLYAYSVNVSTGLPSQTAIWDAGTNPTQTANIRGASIALSTAGTNSGYTNSGFDILKSNDSSGNIVDFNTLDSAAFSSSSPTVDTIKNYTINPSYNSGIYLGGRASNSMIGEYSDQSMSPILFSPPNSLDLLSDPNYQVYAQNLTNRESRVLFQNDDGFLYSIYPTSTSATLRWGWMPRNLVAGLKDYNNFYTQGNMAGGLKVVDAPTTGTGYATYVLGTAQHGGLHYALKLDNAGNPSTVAWLLSNAGSTSPNNQASVVTYIPTGSLPEFNAYANYITISGTTNTLNVVPIKTSATLTAGVLNLTVGSTMTSDLFLDSNVLYLGDSASGVWSMNQSNTAQGTVSSLQKIGNTYNNEPVRYVGTYNLNGISYIWATGDTGLTVFSSTKNQDGSYSWKPLWESHIGGSGSWDSTGVNYVANTGGAYPTPTTIQTLPQGSFITARSVVINGIIQLPLETTGSSDVSCSIGSGYYYVYNINNGFYTNGSYSKINADGTVTVVDGNLSVGVGKPMSPTIGYVNGVGVVYASSEQNSTGGVAINSVYKNNTFTTQGVVSWREITN